MRGLRSEGECRARALPEMPGGADERPAAGGPQPLGPHREDRRRRARRCGRCGGSRSLARPRGAAGGDTAAGAGRPVRSRRRAWPDRCEGPGRGAAAPAVRDRIRIDPRPGGRRRCRGARHVSSRARKRPSGSGDPLQHRPPAPAPRPAARGGCTAEAGARAEGGRLVVRVQHGLRVRPLGAVSRKRSALSARRAC